MSADTIVIRNARIFAEKIWRRAKHHSFGFSWDCSDNGFDRAVALYNLSNRAARVDVVITVPKEKEDE